MKTRPDSKSRENRKSGLNSQEKPRSVVTPIRTLPDHVHPEPGSKPYPFSPPPPSDSPYWREQGASPSQGVITGDALVLCVATFALIHAVTCATGLGILVLAIW